MVVGVTVTVALLVNAFRFFTPNEVFPVAYRKGKTAHLDVGGRRGRGDPARRPGPARPDRGRGRAVRPRRLRRLDAAAHPGRRRSRHLPVREALRDEPRAGPTAGTSSGARSSTAASRTRAPFQSVRAARRVRGLHAPPHARRRASRPRSPTGSSSSRPSASTCSSPSSSTTRRRSATPRSTTRSSTRAWRSSAGSGTAGLAHRDIKPANLLVRDGHLVAHRRRVRAGAPVAVAPGRRPRQHDAGARGAHRRRARVRARAAVLHARRDRRGVRRRARCREPDAAAHGHEAGRARPAGAVPGARARAAADLAAAVEPAAHRARGVRGRRACSSACRPAPACFTPAHDLGVDGTPDVRHRQPDDPRARSRCPSAAPGARASRRSRPGGRSAACRSTTTGRASGSTPTSRGKRAVEVTLLPPDDCSVPRRHRGAERRGRHRAATSGSSSSRPTCAARAPTVFDGGCVAYEFAFDGGADRRRSSPTPTARSRSSPGATLVAEVRRDRRPLAVRCRRSRARAVRDACSRWVVLRRGAARGRGARRRRSSRPRCRCGCSGSGAAGARRSSPAASAGPTAVLLAFGSRRLGLGRRRLPVRTHRHRHPRDDGGRGHARPAGAARVARHRRTRRPRRRAAPGPRGEDPDRGAPPLPRAACAWPVARGSDRSSPPPGGPSARRRPSGVTSAPGPRGGGRRLREARPDRGDPGRPHPARRVCDELSSLQNRVAPEPVESIRPALEAELGGTVERRVRRVRLGAARGGVDRPDVPRPGCAPAKRSS